MISQLKMMFAFMPFGALGVLTALPLLVLLEMPAQKIELSDIIGFALIALILVAGHLAAIRVFNHIRKWPQSKYRMGYSRDTWIVAIPCCYCAGLLTMGLFHFLE